MKECLLFLLFCLFFSTHFLFAEYVKYVIDGDTLVLENDQRVRLIGIDAPEIDHPKYNRIGEYFGDEAAIYLRALVQGQEVRLERDHELYDKYGRRLAYVYLNDVLLNRDLVERGFAEATRRFEYKFKTEFLELEEKARAAGLGMWKERLPHERVQGDQGGVPLGIIFLLILAGPLVFRFIRKRM